MRRLVLLALTLSFAPGTASAQDEIVEPGTADCSTPRRALSTWLTNLQDDTMHPRQATRCFDWGAVRIVEEAQQETVATKLKHVLDARGLYVTMDDIPDEEDPADTSQVEPFPNNLPGFYLTRKGSNWVISADTIRHTTTWYDETFAFDIEDYLQDAPPWVLERVMGVAWWQILGLILLILVSLLLRYAVSWIVQTQGARGLAKVVKNLDPDLLKRAARPIGTTAMVILLMYALPTLRLGVDFNRVLMFGLRVAAAVSGVLILYRLVDVGSDIFGKRAESTDTKLDDQLVPLVRKSLKVVTVVLGVVFVLQNMEVEIGSLIAGVSLGGLAFTLAARDTVANLFGSVSIFADQPFQVGDWVKMQGVEGVVEEVGMRSTRVRTFYKSLVSIPNSKVADGVIDNYGMRSLRRTFLTLGVQYDTTPEQIEAFCEGTRAILENDSLVWKDSFYVCFSGFGDSALEIMLYFFFDTKSWDEELRHRHLIYLEILRLAKDLGVEFAFPTRTLHLATRAQETAAPSSPEPSAEELAAAVLAFGPKGSRSRPGGPTITHGFWPKGIAPGASQGTDPDADQGDSRE
ncbi:MAG: mechanosensitive ion channel [Sandaracinaceae bacterium]|nr:mechanosensitive ion channel [Sandaracinaceae bacterium]